MYVINYNYLPSSDNDEEWTSSIINFIPKAEDNGMYIVCKATNEYFPSEVKEDGYIINVHCKFQNDLQPQKVVLFFPARPQTTEILLKSFVLLTFHF